MQTVHNLEHKNQFIITDSTPEYSRVTFQSYTSPVCTLERKNGEVTLTLYSDTWDYSNTTRKHFKLFINENTPFRYENKAQWLKVIKDDSRVVVQ